MRVAVIGTGGTGSAALRFLAKAGHETVGFEQFTIGHDRGSSHGDSRIIRYTYPDPLYTHLMADAYPLWDALEQESGEELFVRCGGLFIGHPEHKEMVETARSLEENRLPYEMLSPEAVQERFPAFRLQPHEAGLYQQSSGFLRASRCVHANIRIAVENGATLYENAPVKEIKRHRDRVVVATQTGIEEAFDRVIVTAGAWIGDLFGHLRLPLTVTRQQVVYLAVEEPMSAFEPPRFPIWVDVDSWWYGFPLEGRYPGVKLACHQHGDTVHPDRVNREVDRSYVEEAARYARVRLQGVSDRLLHGVVCLYTNTPDEDFLLDRVSGMEGVWLVSGCSGRGFKFTLLLGKIAADLATGRDCGHDLQRFSIARYRA
jgi:sarcosine oxidase